MIPVTHRWGQHRVRITVDLLVEPDYADPAKLPAAVHALALKTFMSDMEEAGIPVDHERSTVQFLPVENEDLAAIGQKEYTWTFRFPVPFNHPDTPWSPTS